MMAVEQPRPPAVPPASADPPGLEALVDSLGHDEAAALLDLLGGGTDGPGVLSSAAPAARAAEIRTRVKALAATRPELLARIITSWIKEDRMKGRH